MIGLGKCHDSDLFLIAICPHYFKWMGFVIHVLCTVTHFKGLISVLWMYVRKLVKYFFKMEIDQNFMFSSYISPENLVNNFSFYRKSFPILPNMTRNIM